MKRQGYVYAARVPGQPLVKIGMTRGDPDVRLRQLNNTSVVHDFELEFVQRARDPGAAEKIVHGALSERRVRSNREFFHCTPRRARAAIRRATLASERGTEASDGPVPAPGAWARRASVLFGAPFCLLCLAITASLVTLLVTQAETLGSVSFVAVALTLLFGAGTVVGYRLVRGPRRRPVQADDRKT